MTVREAFEMTWGEIPSDAVCHVHYDDSGVCPAIVFNDPDAEGQEYGLVRIFAVPDGKRGDWEGWVEDGEPVSPDISDRPAEAFLGFFGEDYDRVVQEGAK